MPFPIQRFQTDCGTEFFSIKVQEQLKRIRYRIKFRPNKPASPHLNGKIERSQRTDKTEFYSTVDFDAGNFDEQLAEWQHYFNWDRPHSAHNGNSPMDKYVELSEQTPLWEDVHKNYFYNSERIQNQKYKVDLEIQRLKRSL